MKSLFSSPLCPLLIALMLTPFIFSSCKQKENKIEPYKVFIPEKTDSASIKKYYYEIDSLVNSKKYNEALARHIWFHNHILDLDTNWKGVRLSFAVGGWKGLGNIFPPAKDSLDKIRDVKTQRVIQHGSSKQDFIDVMAINRENEENQKTIQLYELIISKYPLLAENVFLPFYHVLLDEKRYDLIQKYTSDPMTLYYKEKDLFTKMENSWKQHESKTKVGEMEIDHIYNNQEFLTTQVQKLINYCKAIKDTSSAIKIQKDAMAIVTYEKLKDVLKSAY